MTTKRAATLIGLIPLLLALLPSISTSAEKISSARLDNGMRVILVENRATPLVSATIFVKVGSAYENEHNNGLSHLLEHLVFNGTKTRTQEQIYAQQARLGIFEHASTSKDWTTFTFVFSKENLEASLDLLSDMLFNSVIPEEKLAKEKGIVIEELRRFQTSPRQAESQLMEEVFFQGTPYAFTTLGRERIIKELSRKQTLQFYRRYYRPANMVGLFIGDFSPVNMDKLVRKFFSLNKVDKSLPRSPGPPAIITPRKEQRSGSISQLSLAFPGPGVKSRDMPALKLLASVLDGKGPRGLETRLKSMFPSSVLDIASYVELFRDFSRLTIRLTLTQGAPVSAILDLLRSELSDFARQGAGYIELQGAKNRLLTDWARLRDQFHYFAYLNAAYFVEGALPQLAALSQDIEQVSLTDLKRVAKSYLASSKQVTLVITPAKKEKGAAGPVRKKLANGLTLIAQHNPHSMISGIHILVKGRSRLEPEGKAGLADFLMRLLPRVKIAESGRSLAEELERLGALIKVVDNPFLPFDDYSRSRRYSEVRVQVLDRYFFPVLDLLAQAMIPASLAQEEVESVRNNHLSVLAGFAHNPEHVAEGLFYNELFAGHSFSSPLLGNAETIKAITSNDLENFWKVYFSAQNLVVTMVSGHDTESMLNAASARFSSLGSPSHYPFHQSKPRMKPENKEITHQLGARQGYLLYGGLIRNVDPNQRLALSLALAILSKRLKQIVREEKGLAYEVGARFRPAEGFGWFEISLGTKPENLARAQELVKAELAEFKKGDIKARELQLVKTATRSRRLIRTMTTINKAFYLSLSQLDGGPLPSPDAFEKRLKRITVATVKRAVQHLLPTSGLITVLVR